MAGHWDPVDISAGISVGDVAMNDQICEETCYGSLSSHSVFSQSQTRESGDPASEEVLDNLQQEDSGYMEAVEDKEKAEESGYTRTNGRMDQLEEDENSVFNETDEKGCRNGEKFNNESGSRNSASAKKGKSKKSGSGSGPAEQCSSWTSPSSVSYKSCLSSSGASRHKQVRRRNHHHHNQGRLRRQTGAQLMAAFREFLAESVSPWTISCIHMVVDLIVSLTHRCGIAVESGAVALYDFGSLVFFKVTDISGMKQDLRRIADWTWCMGAALVVWVSKATSMAQRGIVSSFGLLSVAVCLGARLMKSVLERLGGERGRRWWLALQNCWVWKKGAMIIGRVRGWFCKRSSSDESSNPESPYRDKCQPGQELERLLALAQVPEDELDPFNVLGVNTHATESELKRAYRQLAVQVHPDKNKHPRAGEAFKVLRAAWDIVSNPETRREYELKRMAATELSRSMNEFLTKLQDDLKEAMNTMMCTKCEGKHKRFEMDREPHEARFCAECNKRHSAEEGDLWAESSMLGLRITYFAFMDGKVYDITEWAGCQRIGISPDTHRVPYHISFGSKSNSGTNRHRSPSDHPPGAGSPADLQDFFNRIFQGGSPADASSNGGFFSSGTPPHHPSGAGAGTGGLFSGPPPQPGFFNPGAQRGEASECWTEGGKHPRRRKKARKPFQR
ncbi:dnaJ homolog subfamily C member 14 [Pygocentrus nattereri]|uniref:J domain-containing protein n=1 Tax=Pygocentrus nattereri TaxID=42514 RepID=A0A3B4DLE3_PYGNA|nr:dnaJ homolog subfamily C member 14 [Pygocentrus nattereri]XP_017560221.1 dnaJ homolog subfamily C member 14 [Pygocentrus nattereri]